jgi:hypothetical protein
VIKNGDLVKLVKTSESSRQVNMSFNSGMFGFGGCWRNARAVRFWPCEEWLEISGKARPNSGCCGSVTVT